MTRRNSIISTITYFANTLLQFAIRTVIIQRIGIDYLGAGNLFSNLFAILTLMSFGLDIVLLNFLYKTVSENNQTRIANIVAVFRKLFFFIMAAMFVVGLILIPLLPAMTTDSRLSAAQINCFYFFVLINHVFNYINLEKISLLKAQQRTYVIKIVSTITNFTSNVLQLVVLLIWKNYYICLGIQVLATLATNLILGTYVKRKNPYLKAYTASEVNPEIRKMITKYVNASFIYKLGCVLLNSTDSILISKFFGTAVTGCFSNYVTLYSLVNTVLLLLVEATMSSIANFWQTKTVKESYRFYRILTFLFFTISAFFSACYITGMEHFISLWIGDSFSLGKGFVYALTLNQYVFTMIYPIWIYRECMGEYVHTKWVILSAGIINILLSLLMNKLMGISGIIIATAISYLITVCTFEIRYYLKHSFKTSIKEYLLFTLRLLAASVLPIVVGIGLEPLRSGFVVLALKFIACLVVTILSFLAIMYKCPERKETVDYVYKLITGKQ